MFKKRKVKKWVDGDSGFFSDGTPFRLSNVRCPEKNRKGSSRATRSASGMTSRTKNFVQWKQVARDKYGREIGEMKNKHGSVNKRLRDRGFKNKGR